MMHEREGILVFLFFLRSVFGDGDGDLGYCVGGMQVGCGGMGGVVCRGLELGMGRFRIVWLVCCRLVR